MGAESSRIVRPLPENVLMRIAIKCTVYSETQPVRKQIAYTFEGTRGELISGGSSKWEEKVSQYGRILVRTFDDFCRDAGKGLIDYIWGLEIWLDCAPDDYLYYIYESGDELMKSADAPKYSLDETSILRLIEIIENKKAAVAPTMQYFQEAVLPKTITLDTHGMSPATVETVQYLIGRSEKFRTIHFSKFSKARWEKHLAHTGIETGDVYDPLVRREDVDSMGSRRK